MNLLPIGDIAPVQGTDYDFRDMRPLSLRHHMHWMRIYALGQKRLEKPRKCATLTVPRPGPVLEVSFHRTRVCRYTTGFGLQEVPISLAWTPADLSPCAGIALEPQNWPDAPNHNDFPSIYLRAGEKYRQITLVSDLTINSVAVSHYGLCHAVWTGRVAKLIVTSIVVLFKDWIRCHVTLRIKHLSQIPDLKHSPPVQGQKKPRPEPIITDYASL